MPPQEDVPTWGEAELQTALAEQFPDPETRAIVRGNLQRRQDEGQGLAAYREPEDAQYFPNDLHIVPVKSEDWPPPVSRIYWRLPCRLVGTVPPSPLQSIA